MRNFKKLAAITMAATMLLGSSLTALAAGPSGGDTGSGSYEGYVEETSVFSASIPTNAANVFNFFVDPNKLLEETGYARLTGKSAADFESGATLFFTRTPSDTVKEFGKDSEKVTAKNMSSYDVDIAVSATITGIDGIIMADSDEIDPSDPDTPKDPNPILYLAIVHDSDEEVVKADEGGLLSGEIAGTPDNFSIQYNAEKGQYEYSQNDGVDDSTWGTYDFYLTGACGGTWTDAQAAATPTVELTWKITDPYAQEAPSISGSAFAMAAGTAVKIPVNLGAGDLAATGISKVTYVKSGETKDVPATNYTFANGVLTFTAAYIDNVLAVVNSREYTITFNDAAKTKVSFTLRTAAAPSIAKTTYTMAAGTDLVVNVDLGAGALAATGISKITYVKSGETKDVPDTNYTFEDGVLTFKGTYIDNVLAAVDSREYTVIFDDAAQTAVVITLTK